MNNQLVTIRLYGALGAKFGRVHRMAVGSAAEAVHALGSQLRGFDHYLTNAKDRGMGFSVFYGKRNLDRDDLATPAFGEDIRIAPMMLGRKNGGWFNILLGVVLIVVGTIVTGMTFGGAAPLGGAMIKMGWGLVIGGVMQLLAPSPPGLGTRDRADNTPSHTFNGPLNTQAQGNPVAVLYGEMIVGSAVLSAGINPVDQAYIPRSLNGPNSGGGGAPPWHNEIVPE